MSLSIVIFAEDYLPNIGGIAVHVHNLAQNLIRAGNQVLVITTKKNLPNRNLLHWKSVKKNIDGVDILEIPLLYSPRNILFQFQIKYRFATIVKNEIKQRRATVFHWHNIYFDPEVAKHIVPLKLRMIFTNHSSQFLQGMMKEPELAYNKLNLSYADFIITPSTQLKEETIKCGVDEERVFFISNGVDTKKFSPDEAERKRFRDVLGLTDEVAVICPRRVVPKCGIVFLAKALKHLTTDRNVKVFFTGMKGGQMTWRDEKYENEVRAEFNGAKSNIKVVELPQIVNKEMLSYYRAMDICVLPSLIEATSISGLEAMSVGLALIGTRVGGIPELVEHNYNGLLVESANEIELAKALNSLIDEDGLRTKLASNARKRTVDEFDWSKIARKTESIYLKQ